MISHYKLIPVIIFVLMSLLVAEQSDKNILTGIKKPKFTSAEIKKYKEKANQLIATDDSTSFICGFVEFDIPTFTKNMDDIESARRFRRSKKDIFPEKDSVIELEFEKSGLILIIVDSLYVSYQNELQMYHHFKGHIQGIENTSVELTYTDDCVVGNIYYFDKFRRIAISCIDNRIAVGIYKLFSDTLIKD